MDYFFNYGYLLNYGLYGLYGFSLNDGVRGCFLSNYGLYGFAWSCGKRG